MEKRSKTKRDLSYPVIIERLKDIMAHGPAGVTTWKKWSGSKLARVMGKDRSQMSRWLNPDNGHEMTITSLLSICKVMGVDPAVLFQD